MRAGGVELARGAIEDLGGEEPQLVVDDQVARGLAERGRPLGVPLGRAVRLVGEVEVDGGGRALLEGLAAVAERGRRSTVAGSIVGKISAFERGR